MSNLKLVEGKTSIADLIKEHNTLAKAAGVDPLKQWKGSKDKLTARIAKLRTKAEAAPAKADKPAAKKAKGIGAYVIEQLTVGKKTYAEILEGVQEKFPGSKTSIGCVRWYASREGLGVRKAS